MAAERIDVSSIVASLAQIVRLHEGNRTPDINALLEQADEACAAVAELIEADKYYDDAQFGLARARYNGDPLDQWVKDCAAADIRRAAALASVQGGAA